MIYVSVNQTDTYPVDTDIRTLRTAADACATQAGTDFEADIREAINTLITNNSINNRMKNNLYIYAWAVALSTAGLLTSCDESSDLLPDTPDTPRPHAFPLNIPGIP